MPIAGQHLTVSDALRLSVPVQLHHTCFLCIHLLKIQVTHAKYVMIKIIKEMYYWAQEMQKLKSITTNIQLQNNFY